MKIAVLGGTGAVGRPAVEAAVAAGHEVVATARSEDAARELTAIGARAIDVDLYDVPAMQRAMHGCDAVVRLATKIPKSVMPMRSKAVWNETNRLRTLGAERAVDAALAAGVRIYITESFFAAYRSSGDAIVAEDTPSDDGGLATMQAVLETERQAGRFTAMGGNGIALRFGAFYAAKHPGTRELIGMLGKRMLPVVGAGDYFFPPLHVDDAARAIVAALVAPAGVYNVCDERPMRWSEFLDSVAQIVSAPRPMRIPGFLGPLVMGYPWQWMTRSVRLANGKFKRETSWEPAYPDVLAGLAPLRNR